MFPCLAANEAEAAWMCHLWAGSRRAGRQGAGPDQGQQHPHPHAPSLAPAPKTQQAGVPQREGVPLRGTHAFLGAQLPMGHGGTSWETGPQLVGREGPGVALPYSAGPSRPTCAAGCWLGTDRPVSTTPLPTELPSA